MYSEWHKADLSGSKSISTLLGTPLGSAVSNTPFVVIPDEKQTVAAAYLTGKIQEVNPVDGQKPEIVVPDEKLK